MKAIRAAAIIIGLGVIVALYLSLGSGALGTGDQQLGAAIPGPAGGVSSSPSAGATSSVTQGATAGQQQTGGNAPVGGTKNATQSSGLTATTAMAKSHNPILLLVSPGNIVPENVLTASGQGFDAGEQVDITISSGGRTTSFAPSRVVADKDGNFFGLGITVTLGTPAGDYGVTARGRNSGYNAQASFHVTGSAPFVNPSTYAGKGASAVSFQGDGFQPGEIVSVHFDSLAVDPLAQVIANRDGAVAITTTVPLASPGDHAFIVVGGRSNLPSRVPFSVVGFGPWISPTDYSPRPEQLIGFTGHDFAPGEEVKIYQGQVGEHPIGVAHADNKGEFAVNDIYELPDNSVGTDRFLAQGIHSRTVVSATVNVLPFDPSLELSVYAGQPGTTVTFKGTGYAHGETITAYLGGANGGREVAKFQVGADGSFENVGSFTVPGDFKAGNVTVAVVGERSRRPLDISFAVLPLSSWAGLSQFAGPPGTSLSFEGHGFLPGENVKVHLGDRQGDTVARAAADASGSFEAAGPYAVSSDARDKVTFLLIGESSQSQATATFTVTEEGGSAATSSTTTYQISGGGSEVICDVKMHCSDTDIQRSG